MLTKNASQGIFLGITRWVKLTKFKGDRYQVKWITVKPGSKLSVQMHHQRAEHWIVVQSGSYQGEDDIVRFEDIYVRVLS